MHYVDYANELICIPRTWEYMESKPTNLCTARPLSNLLNNFLSLLHFVTFLTNFFLFEWTIWQIKRARTFILVLQEVWFMLLKIAGSCHAKRSLMSWVGVIPKKDGRAWPRPSFFWYDIDFSKKKKKKSKVFFFKKKKSKKSVCQSCFWYDTNSGY